MWPWIVVGVTAILPYLPFLRFRFISDSYLQVVLGRMYGAVHQWPHLAADPLYRCRATSIVLTRFVDALFGPDPQAHHLLSLGVHVINVILVAFLILTLPGVSRGTAWLTAAVFACTETFQEAVIWIAALPELLVFTFVLLALIAWQRAIRLERPFWLFVSSLAYLLALLSKESAVVFVPLAACWWLWQNRNWRVPVIATLGLLTLVTIVYAYLIFTAKQEHLHFNDGTFSLAAPFWATLAATIGRLLLPWGLASLAILFAFRVSFPAVPAAVWVILTLLPYSFLTYMGRSPSRHTYLASVGVALLVAWGIRTVRIRAGWTPALLAVLSFVIFNVGYLWTKKHSQYVRRLEPTEHFLRTVKHHPGPILIRCAPYGFQIYQSALHVEQGRPFTDVPDPKSSGFTAGTLEYCDPSRP